MAERKVVSTTGLLSKFEISVKDRENTVKATFDACKDAASFPAYIGSLKGEQLETAYGWYIYAADLKARASAREAVATDSTIIKRDGKEIDLMKLPVVKAMAAVNAAFGLAASVGGDPQGAFVATRRKLLEAGSVVDKDGVLSAK